MARKWCLYLGGVSIGSGCVIGAGAVVVDDIPDNCIAVGCPAKVIKRFCEKEEKWENVKQMKKEKCNRV